MQALPIYTDFQSLATLRSDKTLSADDRLEEAARQFSAVFTHMLLKSMRQASLGEGIFDSEQSDFYRDLFDQQLALQLTRGEGLGIAKMLVNQFRPSNDAAVSAGANAYEDVKRWSLAPQEKPLSDANLEVRDTSRIGH